MHRFNVVRSPRMAAAVVTLALTGLVLVSTSGAAPAASGLQKVDAQVLRAVQGGASTTYWAILRDKADLSAAPGISDWNARGWYVYNRLVGVARDSQGALRSLLKSQGVRYTSFWIINAIQITSGASTLAEVAARPEVASVVPNWSSHIDGSPAPKSGIQTIEWNIQRINAPQVWSTYNDRGDQIPVASIDTGTQWDHPALIKEYRGIHGTAGTVVNHNYNWWDPSHVCGNPSLAPCDNVGHGTHTMGTIVGDDYGSNQIGVAPRAYWFTAKGCESNSCSSSALLSSGQFMLAPTDLNGNNPKPDLRPVVVSNSWGDGGNNQFYRATVQSWVAAGIFPDFANGNSGPSCRSVGSPGDYPESYGVGAFDINNIIASFSSRGPSNVDGGIKPNVSAPGVDVRSSVPNNSYATFSGTSMATPHVAGTIALIIAGAPQWRGDIPNLRMFIDTTAIDMSDLTCGGSSGDNNVWGEGRLDAFGAVTKAKGMSSDLRFGRLG